MNSFFSSIINRVRSFKEEDLRDFVSKKSRVDDVVVSHYLDNQDKFNFSDSLKIGDKELEKIADELSQRFNSVFKLDTKDSDKILSALLERKEVDVKLSDDVDLKITKRLKNGFTLIELMITVAIVGVLGSVAIPSYQDYVARSQISEAIVLASGAKPLVAEYYANYGEYPNSSDIGFNGNTGKYVESIEIQNGNIIAKLNNNVNEKIRGKLIILNPKGDGSDIIISSNSIFDKLLGISSAIANNQNGWNCFANVEQKYLPKTCETREFSNENGGSPSEENFDLWGGSGQFEFKIEDDKPYKIKDFNVSPLNQNGSVLDLSSLTNGTLENVVFERSGSNTLVKIDGLNSNFTLENIDLSQDGLLSSEQIKVWLLQRGKLKF